MAKSKKKRRSKRGSNKATTSKRASRARRRPVLTELPPPEILEHLGLTAEAFKAIREFHGLPSQARVKASRKVIQDCVIKATEKPDPRFALALAESESLLEGYATLDDQHRGEIENLIKHITAYLRDPTRKRPLNALMLAAPGAGKSHFIKQLAATMEDERVQAVTFNMATMQSADDMAQPIDELRNLKVNDRFPLLFLDEFDSDPSRFALLLPLLWDGQLQIGHRDLRLGKAVIVLAGSNPDLPTAMDQSAKMRLEGEMGEVSAPPAKLVDLLSRINSDVINIPPLDLRSEDRDRRVDKVCIAVALIKARFGNDLNEIPRCLLRFVAHTSFRYGVRSIAHLVDLIESRAFRSEQSLLDSSLKLHLLDRDEGFGIVNRWKELAKDKITLLLQAQQFLRFSRGRFFLRMDS
jgi:hypothetical protein